VSQKTNVAAVAANRQQNTCRRLASAAHAGRMNVVDLPTIKKVPRCLCSAHTYHGRRAAAKPRLHIPSNSVAPAGL
jgi:hypothetical protein